MKKPLITVIMPAYNAKDYIVQAMDSVVRQTLAEGIELIVVDDCSTDQTVETVRGYIEGFSEKKPLNRQIRFLQNASNAGVAQSRNLGIRNAQGAYVAFLDADDWWETQKLEKQMQYIRETGAVLCATGRELMRPDGTSLGKVIGIEQEVSYQKLLRTNSIPCSSVVLKTEVAREFYMYHDELHEDYILWLKVLKKYGNAAGINEPLLKSRMSPGGKSRNKMKSAQMQYGVYRYMGIGRIRSLLLMCSYMVHGILKYL